MTGKKKVGLALSGGSAWGLAHLGVLEVIEGERIPVDVIAGTSAGSLVGALYAAGVGYKGLLDLARRTKWRDLININRSRLGLVGTERLETYLNRHLGPCRFADLALPLAVVACDLSSGAEVTLTAGPVARAVRASCAIPGIFTPVEVEGRLLVDGGVVCNLPVRAARSLGADIVIAVDLGAHALGWSAPAHVFQVIIQTIILMQRSNVQRELPLADVVIEPEVSHLSLMDLDHPDPYLAAGRRAAEEALPRIKELVHNNRQR